VAFNLVVDPYGYFRLVTIPGAGHIVNLDARDAFNRALDGFLPQR